MGCGQVSGRKPIYEMTSIVLRCITIASSLVRPSPFSPYSYACRRSAPPGFRAAPRADFVVTAIRLQSLTPSRLRHCALRLPPGESPAGYPRRAVLGALRCRRTGCAGSARPAPRCGGRGAGTRRGRLCRFVPSSTLAVPAHHVTKDGSRTTRPASLWSFHDTPQERRRNVQRGRSRLSSGG